MFTLDLAIIAAKNYLGESYFSNLKINYIEDSDSTLIEVIKEGSDITIRYGEKVNLFYGLTLIKQNYKKDNYSIKLNRHFSSNGLMHDCSRNGPLNITQAKEHILVSALFGLNRLLLYTEDIYEVEGFPFFGYLRGKYTKSELKELVSYSKIFGVTLIPCIQTLAHLNGPIKWSAFHEFCDSEQTLLIGHPKTYELIENMIKSMREVFDVNTIHIGMDEAIDIGLNTFKFNDVAINKKEAFLKHLNRVVEICQKYDFKPMMWGDMFFKLDADNSNGHVNWYNFKGNLSSRVESLIPDVDLIYWDYYNNKSEVYNNMFSAFNHTNKEIIFSDGAISWIGFVPNIRECFKIMKVGLDSAVKNNIKHLLLTSWGDNGNECSTVAIYPHMALHSVYEFYGKYSKLKISKILETVTGDPLSRWTLLQEVNHLREEQTPFENLSKPFFYQDILYGTADKLVKLSYSEHFLKVAKELRKASRKSKKYSYVFKSASLLSDFLSSKSTIGVRLRDTYKNSSKEELKPFIKELRLLKIKLSRFLKAYRYQWHKENKSSGFDVIDGRIGFLNARIDTAIIKIKAYLNNEIDLIEELEEEILPWHGKIEDDGTLIGYWNEVCSPNVL
jgi:hypothetical protein